MKHRKCLLVLQLLIFICTGCTSAAQSAAESTQSEPLNTEVLAGDTDIEQAVTAFWNADYRYHKTTITVEDGDEYRITVEGEVTASPYREYQEIIDSNVTSSYTKSYYYEDGETTAAMFNAGDTWQKVGVKRSYPYGYGEDLILELDSEKTEENASVQVYNTQYEVDLTETYPLEEPVTAVVTQIYYLDTASKTLTRIETDLTDLKEKTWIANYCSANGESLSEAEAALADQLELSEHETLEITGYGDVEIELPSE